MRLAIEDFVYGIIGVSLFVIALCACSIDASLRQPRAHLCRHICRCCAGHACGQCPPRIGAVAPK